MRCEQKVQTPSIVETYEDSPRPRAGCTIREYQGVPTLGDRQYLKLQEVVAFGMFLVTVVNTGLEDRHHSIMYLQIE
jgi:hypothetical protein